MPLGLVAVIVTYIMLLALSMQYNLFVQSITFSTNVQSMQFVLVGKVVECCSNGSSFIIFAKGWENYRLKSEELLISIYVLLSLECSVDEESILLL